MSGIHKIILVAIIVTSLFLRLLLLQFYGGDQPTYKEAVEIFAKGGNPYSTTITSYKTEFAEHGYAYLPTLLYIQTFFYKINEIFNLDKPLHILWKIPVIISDYVVAFFIYKEVKKRSKNLMFPIISIGLWLFNPYILTRFEINSYDLIGIGLFFLGISIDSKKSFLSGFLLFLAGSIKLFSFVCYPYIFLRTKNKIQFILGSFTAFFLISIPFLSSFNKFMLMIQGSILVHSNRGFQGRPVIGLLSYVTQHVGLVLTTPIVFTILAISSLLIPTMLSIYFYRKSVNLYKSVFILILLYLVLTPVLSRTHIFWLIPFFLVYLADKSLRNQLVSSATLYFFLFLHLFLWHTGFSFTSTGKTFLKDFSIKETRIYKMYKFQKYQNTYQ